MASVFVLLEAFNRKEAAALGFFPCATASCKNGMLKMKSEMVSLVHHLSYAVRKFRQLQLARNVTRVQVYFEIHKIHDISYKI